MVVVEAGAAVEEVRAAVVACWIFGEESFGDEDDVLGSNELELRDDASKSTEALRDAAFGLPPEEDRKVSLGRMGTGGPSCSKPVGGGTGARRIMSEDALRAGGGVGSLSRGCRTVGGRTVGSETGACAVLLEGPDEASDS